MESHKKKHIHQVMGKHRISFGERLNMYGQWPQTKGGKAIEVKCLSVTFYTSFY